MTDNPTTPPPGGQPQALMAEREADLRADHQCSEVDTWCRAAGCKQDWPCATAQLLAALDEARSEVMRLQDNDSAYDVGYQRADAAAGAVIDRLRQERDEARTSLAAVEAERDRAVEALDEQIRHLQVAIEQARDFPCPECGHRLVVACAHDVSEAAEPAPTAEEYSNG